MIFTSPDSANFPWFSPFPSNVQLPYLAWFRGVLMRNPLNWKNKQPWLDVGDLFVQPCKVTISFQETGSCTGNAAVSVDRERSSFLFGLSISRHFEEVYHSYIRGNSLVYRSDEMLILSTNFADTPASGNATYAAYQMSIDLQCRGKDYNGYLDSSGRIAGRIEWPMTSQWSVQAILHSCKHDSIHDLVAGSLAYNHQTWQLKSSVSTQSGLTVEYAGLLSKRLQAVIRAHTDLSLSSPRLMAIAQYKGADTQFGCAVSTSKNYSLFISHKPVPSMRLVAKMDCKMDGDDVGFHLGCLYKTKDQQLQMVGSTSGILYASVKETLRPNMAISLSLRHHLAQKENTIGFGIEMEIK